MAAGVAPVVLVNLIYERNPAGGNGDEVVPLVGESCWNVHAPEVELDVTHLSTRYALLVDTAAPALRWSTVIAPLMMTLRNPNPAGSNADEPNAEEIPTG